MKILKRGGVENWTMEVRCPNCGAELELNASDLFWVEVRIQPTQPFFKTVPSYECGHCENKNRTFYDIPTEVKMVLPSERKWKNARNTQPSCQTEAPSVKDAGVTPRPETQV